MWSVVGMTQYHVHKPSLSIYLYLWILYKMAISAHTDFENQVIPFINCVWILCGNRAPLVIILLLTMDGAFSWRRHLFCALAIDRTMIVKECYTNIQYTIGSAGQGCTFSNKHTLAYNCARRKTITTFHGCLSMHLYVRYINAHRRILA